MTKPIRYKEVGKENWLYIFDTGAALETKDEDSVIKKDENTYIITDPKARIHILRKGGYLPLRIGKKRFIKVV